MSSARFRILVLFAHPALESSRVNRVLVKGLADMEGVTFHDLYEAYPDFDIDVRREQALLLEHDVVVFHHPLFWYSTPALLKQWEDLVLEHGWAYGQEGVALHGKRMMSALTAGGDEAAYQPNGLHGHTIGELLLPFEKTANLCGMRYLEPFVVFGTLRMDLREVEAHAARYEKRLRELQQG